MPIRDPLEALRLPRPAPPEPKIWATRGMGSRLMFFIRNDRGFIEVVGSLDFAADGTPLPYEGPETH